MLYLVVFLGAGIGGVLRHAMNVLALRLFGYGFPYRTLLINVAGSFLIGVLASYCVYRTGVPQTVRLFLVTGILGGFTTFSTFSLDALLLRQRQDYAGAAFYIVGSVAICLFAAFAGLALFWLTGHLP
jgi:fluoride exporter